MIFSTAQSGYAGGCNSSSCGGDFSAKEFYDRATDIISALRKLKKRGPIVVQDLEEFTEQGILTASEGVEVDPEDLNQAFKSVAVATDGTLFLDEKPVDFLSTPKSGHVDFTEKAWKEHPDERTRMVIHELLMLASQGNPHSKYDDYRYRYQLSHELEKRVTPVLKTDHKDIYVLTATAALAGGGTVAAVAKAYTVKKQGAAHNKSADIVSQDFVSYDWDLGNAIAKFELHRGANGRVLVQEKGSNQWSELWKGQLSQLPVSRKIRNKVQEKLIEFGVQPLVTSTHDGAFFSTRGHDFEYSTLNYIEPDGKQGIRLDLADPSGAKTLWHGTLDRAKVTHWQGEDSQLSSLIEAYPKNGDLPMVFRVTRSGGWVRHEQLTNIKLGTSIDELIMTPTRTAGLSYLFRVSNIRAMPVRAEKTKAGLIEAVGGSPAAKSCRSEIMSALKSALNFEDSEPRGPK